MKITKQYLRKLIKESMQQMKNPAPPAPIAEAAGKRIWLVGVVDEYQNDMVYSVCDSLQAVKKVLKSASRTAEDVQVWSYPITNAINVSPEGLLTVMEPKWLMVPSNTTSDPEISRDDVTPDSDGNQW